MNMGPGQAKQCQLRAFLTYYINDLFLNQVSDASYFCLTEWHVGSRCFRFTPELSKTFLEITNSAVGR